MQQLAQLGYLLRVFAKKFLQSLALLIDEKTVLYERIFWVNPKVSKTLLLTYPKPPLFGSYVCSCSV